MATDNPVTAGVAGRYASALFELAQEQNRLDEVDRDLGTFQALLDQSSDLKRLVHSPAFAAEEQQRALGAVMDWASIGATTGNFLKVVAAQSPPVRGRGHDQVFPPASSRFTAARSSAK